MSTLLTHGCPQSSYLLSEMKTVESKGTLKGVRRAGTWITSVYSKQKYIIILSWFF